MMSSTRPAVPVAMILLLVALTSCGALEEFGKSFEANTAGAPPPAPKVKPKRVIPPPPRPKPMAALAATRDARPSGPTHYDPELLIGLKPAQAIASLGNPASVMERSPSMVWRYNVKGCALDLFFYMDLGDNAFRVLAYDMKSDASSAVAARACLGHFRAAPDGR